MSSASAGDRPVLVTGGCGFVGRHVVGRLVRAARTIWLIDDLSTGQDPSTWLPAMGLTPVDHDGNAFLHANGARVVWRQGDLRQILRRSLAGELSLPTFGDVIHLAGAAGGRMKIDGDPLSVATDLAIDFIHIEDCVTVKRRALDVIHDGSAINIGSGQLTTCLQFAGLFAELADYQPEISPRASFERVPPAAEQRIAQPVAV